MEPNKLKDWPSVFSANIMTGIIMSGINHIFEVLKNGTSSPTKTIFWNNGFFGNIKRMADTRPMYLRPIAHIIPVISVRLSTLDLLLHHQVSLFSASIYSGMTGAFVTTFSELYNVRKKRILGKVGRMSNESLLWSLRFYPPIVVRDSIFTFLMMYAIPKVKQSTAENFGEHYAIPAGTTLGLFGAALSHPLELMIDQHRKIKEGALHTTAKNVFKTFGYSSFFKGLFPFRAAAFVLFSQLTPAVKNEISNAYSAY